MKVGRILFVSLVSMMLTWGTCNALTLPEVRIGGQMEIPTFPFWLAKEKGWDREEGFKIELLTFDSGMAMLNTLPSGEWHIGVAGTGFMGGLRFNTYIIAIANNDNAANGVLARPDNSVFKHNNPQSSDVYADPADVKGKTILTTRVSAGHYMTYMWLRSLGLTEKDIIIQNMEQAQALTAFENKIGDFCVFWGATLVQGKDKGYKLVADGNDVNAGVGTWIMCAKEFGDKNPELVSKVLRVYLRGVDMLKNETPEKMIPIVKRFMIEYGGMEATDQMAAELIKASPVYTYEEQIKMFSTAKGMSVAQTWLASYARFLFDTKSISKEEYESVKDIRFATDKFLKLVQVPTPPHK